MLKASPIQSNCCDGSLRESRLWKQVITPKENSTAVQLEVVPLAVPFGPYVDTLDGFT